MTLLEAAASLLGLANIILLVRRSIWNYPFGLAMVAITAALVFDKQLYSDAALQVFFFVVQLYGWWAWARAGGNRGQVPVASMAAPARAVWIVGIALVSVALGAAMRGYTDATLPWLDAAQTVMSMAAQILLARRRIENWVLWIVVDVITVGMYIFKDLYWLSGLYVLFLVFSVLGLREWARARRGEASA